MDKMKIYESALRHHVTGVLSESDEQDVKDAPFDGGKPSSKTHKDEYGNTIKTKNMAKHLAKKGMKSVSEEDILAALEELDFFYEQAMELQDVLEEAGVDFEDLFSALDEDAVDEGFQSMSKTKQLIARRKAGRSKKLTSGYAQKNNSRRAKKAKSIQPGRK